jgi:hypothetical protein
MFLSYISLDSQKQREIFFLFWTKTNAELYILLNYETVKESPQAGTS